MIKQHLEYLLSNVVTSYLSSQNLPVSELDNTGKVSPGSSACVAPQTLKLEQWGLRLERPKNEQHGDYAVNVSPLAKQLRQGPPQIAEALNPLLDKAFQEDELGLHLIGGFINVSMSHSLLSKAIHHVLEQSQPGLNDDLAGQSILLEYVSANPTGPLHIGHGRWAALGDSLVRIFRHCGAVVTPEFYVNDAGLQVLKIGYSIYLRALEILHTKNPLSGYTQPTEFPYPGEYVIDLAQAFLSDTSKGSKNSDWVLQQFQHAQKELNPAPFEAIEADEEAAAKYDPVIQFALSTVLTQQQVLLENLGVHFEAYFFEKAYLHQRDLVTQVLDQLKHDRFAYMQDGALWLNSSEFGDEKDRVLIKSDGSYTYLAADIAYHHQKFSRLDDNGNPQYNRFINIWGADHHGYIARMRAAIQALGHPVEQFEVLLGQLVNLVIDGEKTRMGKRRKMLTLEDVVSEVGVDATRFWMVSKSADTALDFDVELATSQTDENPVFYAQYAHARCASILRNALHPPLNTQSVTDDESTAPFVSEAAYLEFEATLTPGHFAPLFQQFLPQETPETVLTALKQLILKLDSFEDSVIESARFATPHSLARYSLELATAFHRFYNTCRVLTPDPTLTLPRLFLILAVKKTLAQALELLGVSAPERM
ncbi:MAG: arginine--tRNA ligase [Cyanobacteria bacterium]|nr:arginine--tRNA ligase [Cyanobacteriota bacterium]